MEHTSHHKKYLPSLDVLRFVGFILIFLHHTALPDSLIAFTAKKAGWIGVDIFFCLSAFLLGRLLLAEKAEMGVVDLKKYFMRRILRIWPLYFSYLLFALVCHLALSDIPIDGGRIAGLFTFTDNVWSAADGYNSTLFTPHLWTISFEEQFYLILPFLIIFLYRFSPKKQFTFLCLIWAITMVLRLLMVVRDARHPTVYTLPITHLDPIITGLLLAAGRRGAASLPDLLLAIVLLGVPLLMTDASENGYHLLIIYPCVAVGSMYAVKFCAWSPYHLTSNNIFVYLGRISFGLYIFHIAALNIVASFLNFDYEYLQAIFGFFTTVGLAVASYHLFEKRFLDLKKKFYPVKETQASFGP